MYEDWVEETIQLLETLATTPAQETGKLLIHAFNDLDKVNSITQHFRVKDFPSSHRSKEQQLIISPR